MHGVAQPTFVLQHTILSIPLHSILFVQQGLPIGQSAAYVKDFVLILFVFSVFAYS